MLGGETLASVVATIPDLADSVVGEAIVLGEEALDLGTVGLEVTRTWLDRFENRATDAEEHGFWAAGSRENEGPRAVLFNHLVAACEEHGVSVSTLRKEALNMLEVSTLATLVEHIARTGTLARGRG